MTSMMTGKVTFKGLATFGKARLSDPLERLAHTIIKQPKDLRSLVQTLQIASTVIRSEK